MTLFGEVYSVKWRKDFEAERHGMNVLDVRFAVADEAMPRFMAGLADEPVLRMCAKRDDGFEMTGGHDE